MSITKAITIATTPPAPVPLVSNSASTPTLGGLSFSDLVDAVNPLQHIPVVSGIYRAATGSNISTVSKIAGDTIYGLALGGVTLASAAVSAASSAADSTVQAISGSNISSHIVNTVSAITTATSTARTGTPLVPDQPYCSRNYRSSACCTQFSFPWIAIPKVTAAQYAHATVMDTVNKKLVGMS